MDNIEDCGESVAENSEEFLEKYLEENYNVNDIEHSLSFLIKKRNIYPVCKGSALDADSVRKFLDVFDRLTYTDFDEKSSFKGIVYKIRNIDTRLTFIKCLSGSIKVREELKFEKSEKINEIRFYNGDKYENKQIA